MSALDPKTVSLPHSFQSMTMAKALRATTRRNPGKTAITHNDKSRTYQELSTRTDRLTAAAISDLKINTGDNVAIVAKNSIEYVEVVCGLPEAGAAVATVNPKLTTAEIEGICNDARARVVFVDEASCNAVENATFETVERVVHLGKDYEALLSAAQTPDAYPVIHEWDTWCIPYTSGTTGKPKGVCLSHRSRVLAFYQQALEFGCYSPDDRFLGTTPMNHGAGIAFPLAAIMFGGFTEILDHFDPELLLKKLKEGNFAGVFTVPTQHHAIFELEQPVLDKYRGAPLKALISNASALPQHLKHKIVAYFGEGLLHETYGSTEAGFVTNLRPPYQLQKERCVGTPFAHTFVKLTDEDFTEVGPEEPGELWVKSPSAFNGYWNRAQETDAAFHDGWITVGDVAKRDADGFVYIVDRKTDMVITGGVNVYPREIEELLFTHPAIADAAVVGVPDDKWGERLKAFVVLKAGKSLETPDLAKFCAGQLASYKIPKEMAVLGALPRNANGKVLKTELRKKG
ncbi:MAG: class I adenylate-forming enzyme family protein [Rhodospirillaceae bacterium]